MRTNYLLHGFLVLLFASLMLGATEWIVVAIRSGLAPAEEDAALSPKTPTAEAPAEEILENPIAEAPAEAAPLQPPHPLSRFYQALFTLRQQPDQTQVRIAYFGDSMIEGDLITQSLRHKLQSVFGGAGVGFVPTTSLLWGYRTTIRQRFDESQWFSANVLTKKPSGFEYGISGEMFLSNTYSPWLSLKGTDEYPETEQLYQARLFYGPASVADAKGEVETEWNKSQVRLDGKNLVNAVLLADSCGEELDIRLHAGSKFPVYGLSVSTPYGLVLDNFGMRNSTGAFLSKISEESLQQFQQHLGYDLVVLQFGLNLVNASRDDFSKYEEALRKLVARFRVAMPGADLLIVSVGDKCSRQGNGWKTDPSIPLIVEVQRKVAEETGVGFLNLFEEMGGENAMVEWVNARPSLARGDYAHPNRLGAERVADIVEGYLLKGYETFIGQPLSPELASSD